MWLQRVLFNLQTRLLGRDDQIQSTDDEVWSAQNRRETERMQLLKTRLVDLDRRLEQLR